MRLVRRYRAALPSPSTGICADRVARFQGWRDRQTHGPLTDGGGGEIGAEIPNIIEDWPSSFVSDALYYEESVVEMCYVEEWV